MTLFGGGECDLRLENPEAPLDCDIEVHASPRGKRTQRINLLSSGERALVALSLLFGIFLTKPSPFCLLDEVDAPLDDANIGRMRHVLARLEEDRTRLARAWTGHLRSPLESGACVSPIRGCEDGSAMLQQLGRRVIAVGRREDALEALSTDGGAIGLVLCEVASPTRGAKLTLSAHYGSAGPSCRWP